jgi:hypothetical protein
MKTSKLRFSRRFPTKWAPALALAIAFVRVPLAFAEIGDCAREIGSAMNELEQMKTSTSTTRYSMAMATETKGGLLRKALLKSSGKQLRALYRQGKRVTLSDVRSDSPAYQAYVTRLVELTYEPASQFVKSAYPGAICTAKSMPFSCRSPDGKNQLFVSVQPDSPGASCGDGYCLNLTESRALARPRDGERKWISAGVLIGMRNGRVYDLQNALDVGFPGSQRPSKIFRALWSTSSPEVIWMASEHRQMPLLTVDRLPVLAKITDDEAREVFAQERMARQHPGCLVGFEETINGQALIPGEDLALLAE